MVLRIQGFSAEFVITLGIDFADAVGMVREDERLFAEGVEPAKGAIGELQAYIKATA